MNKNIKDIWGKNLEINTEVVNGLCPYCEQDVILVSLFSKNYRCINCGGNIQQRVNGVISYIPVSASDVRKINLDQSNGSEKT